MHAINQPSRPVSRAPLRLVVQDESPQGVLLGAVRSLSMARSIEEIADVVRRSARKLAQADGATFVLPDNGFCHYLDEDAIEPLWKGMRFPMDRCIGGWAMTHSQSVVIPDVYGDDRIPHAAYRPTFIKSLLMVPIRPESPLGAIGVYWAVHHDAPEQEQAWLQALADSTSVAMESVRLHLDLERRVRERTAELRAVNEELEAFTAAVSHDLRSPLHAINGFSELIERRCGAQLDAQASKHLHLVRQSALRMSSIVSDLLGLSRASRAPLKLESVDLAELARDAWAALQTGDPDQVVSLQVPATLPARGDGGLLRIALDNLLSNARKYSSKRADARVEVGMRLDAELGPVYFVRDNGAGFDSARASDLFEPFHRQHLSSEFAGVGVGLTTVKRVMTRHGGRVWADSRPGDGATFYFTLGEATG